MPLTSDDFVQPFNNFDGAKIDVIFHFRKRIGKKILLINDF